jgi:hypothetical protein
VSSNDSQPAWLFIGATDVEDEPGVTTVDGMDEQTALQYVVAERITISCVIHVWTGDVDGNAATLRAAAYTIRDQLELALKPDAQMVVLGLQGVESGRVTTTEYTAHVSDASLVVTLTVQGRTATI